MVDRIRYPTVSYLPLYYVFFQFLLLTIFNLQANILTTKDILSNLGYMLGHISMFMDCLRKQTHQCAQYKLQIAYKTRQKKH